jgi:tetratricopeptide (TPR) repeat protein
MTSLITRIVVSAAVALLLILVQEPGSADPDQARASLEQGVQAFRSGEYERALKHFGRARQLGTDTPGLHYNLGATYYRLGRYSESRAEFEQLLQVPRLAPLARYNLGLIALEQGRDEQAREAFESAVDSARDDKLRALAQQQLAQLPVQPRRPQRWFGFVDAGGGYDDNVALVPDAAVVVPTGKDDSFTELMGGFVAPLNGGAQDGFRVKASAFWLNYLDLDEFDQVSARGGLAYRSRAGAWRTELYGFGDLIYLDKDPFERIATLSYEADRGIGMHESLRLRARSSYIDADSDFDALTGWRNQLLAEVRHRHDRIRLRGGYEFEYNDRDDRSVGGEFASRSPLRHTFFVKASRDVARDVGVFLDADYRYSRYLDPDRFVSGGVASEKTRREDRYRVRAGAEYYLAPEWILTGEYQYTRNDSNLDAYEYTSNRFTARLEYVF